MALDTTKRLRRSRDQRMIAGVCGGLGEYFSIDPTLIRLIFAILFFAGLGSSLIVYVILWVVMPQARSEEASGAGLSDSAFAGVPEPPPAAATFSPEEVEKWDLDPAGVQRDPEP